MGATREMKTYPGWYGRKGRKKGMHGSIIKERLKGVVGELEVQREG